MNYACVMCNMGNGTSKHKITVMLIAVKVDSYNAKPFKPDK